MCYLRQPVPLCLIFLAPFANINFYMKVRSTRCKLGPQIRHHLSIAPISPASPSLEITILRLVEIGYTSSTDRTSVFWLSSRKTPGAVWISFNCISDGMELGVALETRVFAATAWGTKLTRLSRKYHDVDRHPWRRMDKCGNLETREAYGKHNAKGFLSYEKWEPEHGPE